MVPEYDCLAGQRGVNIVHTLYTGGRWTCILVPAWNFRLVPVHASERSRGHDMRPYRESFGSSFLWRHSLMPRTGASDMTSGHSSAAAPDGAMCGGPSETEGVWDRAPHTRPVFPQLRGISDPAGAQSVNCSNCVSSGSWRWASTSASCAATVFPQLRGAGPEFAGCGCPLR